MGFHVQCLMCGALGSLNQCRGGEYWFCGEHLFRHRNCKEGK